MLVTEFHGTASVPLEASPEKVFDLITDIDRLTDWNEHIERIVEHPRRELAEGAEWVVLIRAMGTRWPSRSRVVLLDPIELRFEHTSRTDGNPSYAVWSWQVLPREIGCELTVTWVGYPKTFWRRVLLARIRAPRLDAEVRTSMAGIGAVLGSRRSVGG